LLLGVEIHVSLSCFLEFRKALATTLWISQASSRVKLTMSRVTGGIQTADGDGDSCVLDLLPLGRRLQPYGSLKHRQDDSGDVLLMMSRRRLQPYESLRHRQVDSGDVLLMILLLGGGDSCVPELLEFRKALATVWISPGILKIALVICSRLKLTMSRVTGGVIQTADGDGDSCVLDLLPLGQEALAAYGSLRHRPDDSGDVLLMMKRRLQPYGSLKHRQDDSGDVLLMIRSKHPGKDRADEEILPEEGCKLGSDWFAADFVYGKIPNLVIVM
ncbi:Protein Ltv1, partial [Manis pentadactyla]